ncbi:MAG: hypothetical protein KME23_22625 [Goleter apudmare HA4340-LM2]|jgi:hypothetical protein|nr:hypothetical protein [Goleter apudmare HA4340-LM2]
MLVVVASRHDKAAGALVNRWAAHGASLLTSEDLSMAGWRHYLGSSDPELQPVVTNEVWGNRYQQPKAALDMYSTAVVGGQTIPSLRDAARTVSSANTIEKITGVLIRLPCIFEPELPHIIPEDRAYVAAEMNAFLISWLSRLKCPVLNRPTPTYLLGPAWRPEQWIYAAAQIGIPVRPRKRKVILSPHVTPPVIEQPGFTVTVVGKHCLGTVNKTLAHHARNLADAAKVDLLTVHFSDDQSPAEFLSADLWADISVPEIADAILEYLRGGNAQC